MAQAHLLPVPWPLASEVNLLTEDRVLQTGTSLSGPAAEGGLHTHELEPHRREWSLVIHSPAPSPAKSNTPALCSCLVLESERRNREKLLRLKSRSLGQGEEPMFRPQHLPALALFLLSEPGPPPPINRHISRGCPI